MSDYLTINETAEMFAVSTRTVRRWIEDGTVKAYRVGQRLLRIDIDSVSGVYTSIPTRLRTQQPMKSPSQAARTQITNKAKITQRELRELRDANTYMEKTSTQLPSS